MHRQPAGESQSECREPGDPRIADQAAQQRGESDDETAREPERKQTAGANARGPGLLGASRRRQLRQRMDMKQTNRVKQREPIAQQQAGQIAGMIEVFLRQAVVEKIALIDHEEIHVGDAPIRPPKTEQKKRDDKSRDNESQRSGPTLDQEQLFKAPRPQQELLDFAG